MFNIPTLSEAGIRGYEVDQWYGVITGAKVPRSIVNKLSAAMSQALKALKVIKVIKVIKRLATDGSAPVGSSPDQFTAHIKSEMAK